ncbi:MAG: ribosome small subunit-dependent GTPase A [Candidatus Izemoplasma sp.]|nr:ribosome small subunit-dependent GTPase A [Candidatus Izemoplasma sp.]
MPVSSLTSKLYRKEVTRIKTLEKTRIIRVNYTEYIAEYDHHIYQLQLSGRLKYILTNKLEFPTVGDYVLFRQSNPNEGIIERICERHNLLKRIAITSDYQEQVLASNIDTVFICLSMNEDFHRKKLLRLVQLVNAQNICYEILLTKADLTHNQAIYLDKVIQETEKEAYPLSIYKPDTIQRLKAMIQDQTVVLIGSSGVGKSSMINALLNENKLAVNTIRLSDAQGRHTTTYRELISLPFGGAIIDTPGIRIMHSTNDDVDETFDDIKQLSSTCKFRDCSHETEPGCAVKSAMADGKLSEERLASYHHMLKVQAYYHRRRRQKERLQQK